MPYPHDMKQLISKSKYIFRMITSPLRELPDFIIIGAQKGGTTYLYQELLTHPNIVAALKKEVHYFDLHFDKGVNWYRARFPSRSYKLYSRFVQQIDWLVGESSPYYLFHPRVPQRVAALIPQVKLIVALRNPIDRAYSHYNHQVRDKREIYSFEAALEMERVRLEHGLAQLHQSDHYYSFNHHHFSYLARGIYIDQLKAWQKFFDLSQMLILQSELLFCNANQGMNIVYDFLGLPSKDLHHTKPINQGLYGEMTKTTRSWLQTFFEPYNQRLYSYLGVDFGWK